MRVITRKRALKDSRKLERRKRCHCGTRTFLSLRERAVAVDVHRGRAVVTSSSRGCGAVALPGESPRDGVGASLRTRARVLRRLLFSNDVGERRAAGFRHAV